MLGVLFGSVLAALSMRWDYETIVREYTRHAELRQINPAACGEARPPDRRNRGEGRRSEDRKDRLRTIARRCTGRGAGNQLTQDKLKRLQERLMSRR